MCLSKSALGLCTSYWCSCCSHKVGLRLPSFHLRPSCRFAPHSRKGRKLRPQSQTRKTCFGKNEYGIRKSLRYELNYFWLWQSILKISITDGPNRMSHTRLQFWNWNSMPDWGLHLDSDSVVSTFPSCERVPSAEAEAARRMGREENSARPALPRSLHDHRREKESLLAV